MEKAPQPYKTVAAFGQDEIIINKSRFIGAAAPCRSEREALDFIKERRASFKDASHNCYAYVIGRNSGMMRYSDDGEPGGTAGLPIMEVLKAKAVVDVAVVVTRYFGGVLLGAGGLVRAYTKGCAIGVQAAGVVTMRPCVDVMLEIPYALLGRFENDVKSLPVKTLERQFAAGVTMLLRMPAEQEDGFSRFIGEISAGKAEALRVEAGYFPWED